MFAGASHVIDDDDSDTDTDAQTLDPREPSNVDDDPKSNDDTTFEPREPPRGTQTKATTPTVIPYADEDFDNVKKTAVEAEFHLEECQAELNDPNVAILRHKQSKLSTIPERLGHVSFARLRLLAKAGIIPKDLANVEPPTCPGRAYGKAHRKPWRHKGVRNKRKLRVATCPDQVVSVDQLVSPTPGFVPTHRGRPTTQRYIGATVFVDHFSDYTYVQKNNN
jgi:hypothetical protein